MCYAACVHQGGNGLANRRAIADRLACWVIIGAVVTSSSNLFMFTRFFTQSNRVQVRGSVKVTHSKHLIRVAQAGQVIMQ
jgi:hypothetical protein